MPDLIKKFFDTFEIKPIEKNCKYNFGFKLDMCENCDRKTNIEYPEITDHILLELICILNENATLEETYYQGASTVKELKKLVLKDLIKTKDNFDTIQQVQELFKGE